MRCFHYYVCIYIYMYVRYVYTHTRTRTYYIYTYSYKSWLWIIWPRPVMRMRNIGMDKPLHSCQVLKYKLIINRFHSFSHLILLLFLIYYRVSSISQTLVTKNAPPLPHLLVFSSELILSFIWLLNQAYRWRPVYRDVFPERLPDDEQLPAIDVFICTADPNKEPTLGVMNTVISAMAMDYPADKLNVYLSDDGGSPVTLKAMKEAWRFAQWWLPFCKKFGVKTLCPEAYFVKGNDDTSETFLSSDLLAHKKVVKVRYACIIIYLFSKHAQIKSLVY